MWVAAAAAGTPAEQVAFPESLDDLTIEGGVVLVGGAGGEVLAWDSERRLLAAWDSSGVRRSSCRVDDARLGLVGLEVAYRDGSALLAFADPAPGEGTKRKAAIVDLRRCEVTSTLELQGLATDVLGTSDGWVVAVQEDPFAIDPPLFQLIDDRGRVTNTFSVSEQLELLSKNTKPSGGGRALGSRGARPVVVGREVWLLPHARYELWRPAQHGQRFRTVEPPPCLAAQGVELTGDESFRHAWQLSGRFSDELRSRFRAALEGGATGSTFLASTAGAAAYDTLLAVVVRDPATRDGTRFDIWDMLTESVVDVIAFPLGSRLLALAPDTAWLQTRKGRVERLRLRDVDPATADPCAALIELRRGARLEPEPADQREAPPPRNAKR